MALIAPSARKHGIRDHNMQHACRNPIRRWEMEGGVQMIVGASMAGALMEVGYIETDQGDLIIHAMKARAKFLDGRW